MSRVALKTVIYYQAKEDGCSPLDSDIIVKGVEAYFPDIPFPEKGRTFLYGHNNPAMLYLLERDPANKSAEILTVEAEIGEWFRQKADITEGSDYNIAKTGFLSLARAKRDIVDRFERLMVEEKGADFASNDGFPRKGTRYPRILDKVIALPEFEHLSVISYTVSDAVLGDFQVATVFNEKAYAAADAGARFRDVQFIF